MANETSSFKIELIDYNVNANRVNCNTLWCLTFSSSRQEISCYKLLLSQFWAEDLAPPFKVLYQKAAAIWQRRLYLRHTSKSDLLLFHGMHSWQDNFFWRNFENVWLHIINVCLTCFRCVMSLLLKNWKRRWIPSRPWKESELLEIHLWYWIYLTWSLEWKWTIWCDHILEVKFMKWKWTIWCYHICEVKVN